MNGLKLLIPTLLLFATTVSATETKEFEAGTIAACHLNAAALLVNKQNEGWDCNVNANDRGTCTKDGIRAKVYCNGSKLILTMEKD